MDLKSIAELHQYLEKNVSTLLADTPLTNQLRLFSDTLSNKDLQQAIRFEVQFLDFRLKNGHAEALMSTSTKTGLAINPYPSFDVFTKETYEYLISRAAQARNHYLVARYNQILWNSKLKNQTYCKKAIHAYENLLQYPPKKQQPIIKHTEFSETLINGYSLSLMSKYKIPEFTAHAQAFLFSPKGADEICKLYLLEYLLVSNQIKKANYSKALPLLTKIGVAARKKNPSYYFEKRIYELGLHVAQKLVDDQNIWYKRLGDCMVRYADKRVDDPTKMVALKFLHEALIYYRSGNLSAQVKKIEKKYADLKKGLKLSAVEIDLLVDGADEFMDHVTQEANKVLSGGPDFIIDFLIQGYLFPGSAILKKMQGEQTQSIHSHIASIIKFDVNKNIVKAAKSTSDREYLWDEYHLYYRAFIRPFLYILFPKGILENKISFPILIKHFSERSWLGRMLGRSDLAGTPKPYNWVSLIAPALLDFFKQMEGALKSPQSSYNFILAIDSMTLKFEGALRDFGEMVGITPNKMRKGDSLQEIFIPDILSDKLIKDYFDETDLLLFKFLFVEKEGLNLRNNIAHGFFKFDDYAADYMFLLICAFLRLGKYAINIQEKK